MADKVTGVLNLLKGLVKQTPTSKSTDLVIPTKAELEKLPPEDLEKISNQLKQATNVDRREFLRGALGTIANTTMDVGTLGNLTKMVKPTTKAAVKSANDFDYFNDLWSELSSLSTFKQLKQDLIENISMQDYKNPRFREFNSEDWDELLRDNMDSYSMGINDLDMDELLTGKMSWDEIGEQSGQILQVGKELHEKGFTNEQILKKLNDRLLLGGFEYDPENVKILNNMLKKVDGGELGKPNLNYEDINESLYKQGTYESDGKFILEDKTYDSKAEAFSDG